MTFSGELVAFLLIALVGVVGGMLLLNLSNVVHMVIALVFTFLSIAGIFVLLSAEFLAVVQVLVYSGAITIIMLFGIMLTRHDNRRQSTVGRGRKLLIFLGILGFGLVVYSGIYNLEFPEQAVALHEANVEQIGVTLFSKYVIPFELLGVLLLVALIGAIVLARKDDEVEEADSE